MQVTSPTAEAEPPRRRRIGLVVVGVVVLGLVAAASWLVVRPGVGAASRSNAEVVIECAAATGVSADECAAWGDAILADDPAPRTFEREDLRRLAIDRSGWGFGGECSVAYFLSRYPDRPVWQGEIACR